MRPLFDNNDKLPINHLWGIVERAKDKSELRVFPEEVFRTRSEARKYLKQYKNKWKVKTISVRKLYLNV